MQAFEYKVVPAPAKGTKAKGIKAPEARFAHSVELLLNEMAAEGWEFQRAEMLPSEERAGFTGSTTNWRNLLVFRRPVAEDAEVIAADEAGFSRREPAAPAVSFRHSDAAAPPLSAARDAREAPPLPPAEDARPLGPAAAEAAGPVTGEAGASAAEAQPDAHEKDTGTESFHRKSRETD